MPANPFQSIQDAISQAISNVHNFNEGLVVKATADTIYTQTKLAESSLATTEQKQEFAKWLQSHTSDFLKQASEHNYGILNSSVQESVSRAQDEIEHAVCFVKGTKISTPEGDIAVENLKEGDLINTLSGPKALKWIGYRSLTGMSSFSARSKENSYPIHICANAIADGVPSKDIRVSPWHHLYIDGVLVRAMDVVNGLTIYRADVEDVIYFHLELDGYDMILAHNMYSESFADNGRNRAIFENVKISDLHPDWSKMRGRAPRPGYDHAVRRSGREVVALQERFAKRAKLLQQKTAINN